MLEIFPLHTHAIGTNGTSVYRTELAAFLWGVTMYFTLKSILKDSILPLQPAKRAGIKPRLCVTLPPELTDEVIFHLCDDQKSLASCSRVCKSWLAASQYHLFRVASLQFPVPEQRMEFLKSCVDVLVPRTRHLHIQGVTLGCFMPPRAVEELIPLLTPLARVETLRLCNLDVRDFYTTLALVASTFMVTRLELHDIVFQDVNEMAHFISHFTQLTHLDICPQFRQSTQLTSTVCRLPVGVHSVGYTVGVTGEGSEICDWIALSKEQIHSLDLGIYSAFVDYGYHAILSDFLEALGPYLHRVDISFIDGQSREGGPRRKDLKLSQHMKSSSIVARLSPALGGPSLSKILPLVPSPVSNIVIEVPEPESLDAEDWLRVDDLLGNPRFSDLCDLSFQLPGTFHEKLRYQTLLENSLEKCCTKGILRVA